MLRLIAVLSACLAMNTTATTAAQPGPAPTGAHNFIRSELDCGTLIGRGRVLLFLADVPITVTVECHGKAGRPA